MPLLRNQFLINFDKISKILKIVESKIITLNKNGRLGGRKEPLFIISYNIMFSQKINSRKVTVNAIIVKSPKSF